MNSGELSSNIQQKTTGTLEKPKKDEILSVQESMRNSDIPPAYKWQFEKTLSNISQNGFEGLFGEINKAIYEEMRDGGFEELAGRASNADKVMLGMSDKGVGAMELYRSKQAKVIANEMLSKIALSGMPEWVNNFLSNTEYQPSEIGITCNGQFGLSLSASQGFAFNNSIDEYQFTSGNSRGGGQIGVSICAYIMRSTAPYEVLVADDTEIVYMGGSVGKGDVVGANYIFIKPGDGGKPYTGLMIMAGKGFSPSFFEIHGEKSF